MIRRGESFAPLRPDIALIERDFTAISDFDVNPPALVFGVKDVVIAGKVMAPLSEDDFLPSIGFIGFNRFGYRRVLALPKMLRIGKLTMLPKQIREDGSAILIHIKQGFVGGNNAAAC